MSERSSNSVHYRLGYRADIEGLRAVAILLVIVAHADVGWLAGGFIGVDVFFVLSGYLITGLLLKELRATGTINFSEFYARRIRRLLPGLALMLVSTFAAARLFLPLPDQPRQGAAGASAAAWVSNLYFTFAHTDYFSPGTERNLFLHTWSLGLEEQFYLVWPVLLYLVLKRPGRPQDLAARRLPITMASIFGVSLLLCVVVSLAEPLTAFYLAPTRAWQFALGGLAFLSPLRGGKESMARLSGMLGLGLIAACGQLLDNRTAYPGAWALLPSAGAALVLFAGAEAPGIAASRLLSAKVLQIIGRVSYAWYLWHWPVMLLGAAAVDARSGATRLALALLSLLVAFASHHLLEKRFTASPRWIVRRATAIAVALASTLVLGSVALHWEHAVHDRLAQPEFVRFERVRMDTPVIYRMGCDDSFDSSAVRPCEFGRADARNTAVLIGDSVGVQWFPAIAAAFDRPDWRLVVMTKSSCPMVDEPIFLARLGREFIECAQWRRAALEEVAALDPDVVILGSSAVYGFTEGQWTNGTARVLEPVSRIARHVFVLRPTPVLPFDGPTCLAPQSVWRGLISPRVCTSSAYDTGGKEIGRWLENAARHFPNTTLVDMNLFVCPGDRCRAEQQGMIVFRDAQHLTAAFAASLSKQLGARLSMADEALSSRVQ